MIKQYFTDGLIQIAIILSLLRIDLNNWHPHHNNYINYPEVQDIILGHSFAYTTTNFHNQHNLINNVGVSVHPKSITNEYSSAIFRDLRSLSRFRRFDGIPTEVNAFLVSESGLGLPGSVATAPSATQSSSHSGEDANNNHAHPAIPNQSTSASEEVDNQQTNSEGTCPVNDNDDNVGAIGTPPIVPGTDPTDEDLDLIDVLWRQDIDLGVGKDAFDINLRRELEREREVELQKKREKAKEVETLRLKSEEEHRKQLQQWREHNFTQDGETGEWVPLNADSLHLAPPEFSLPVNDTSLEEVLDILNTDAAATYVNNDYSPVPTTSPQVPIPPQPHLTPPVSDMESFLLNQTDPYNNQTVQPQQPPPQQANLGRQESLDQRWDDLVSLLDLPGINASQVPPHMNATQMQEMANTHMNMSAIHSQAQMNVANMSAPDMMGMSSAVNTSMTGTTQALPGSCVNSSVLLQNATLPVANVSMPTVINNTNMSPINSTGFQAPPSDYNSTMPPTDSLQSALGWNTTDMLFSSVPDNQTDPGLDDVEGMLPDLLPEDELDIAINEGLQTMQMLDEASSDSAVSMGSASPLQELSDSSAMSPYDGLEGATGGSDYGSPSYSKTSKYDPDEYHYGYSSCSYSGHSDSSQTNYSTSSNDTDINKPHNGGNNHINHNHTYPLKPGAAPKEIKTSIKSDKFKMKNPYTRDIKRAQELNVPFSVAQIVESPVEEFNEMITKYKLTEPQIQLIRDIRRRGKNKVAAQNCRKRKLDVVVTLEDEMTNLQTLKEQLVRERQQIDKQTRDMKEKFSHMYQEIFRSLRDDHGNPYDPNEYSLQQSSDGNVFLVPRNVSVDDPQMNGKKRKNGRQID